MAGAAGKVEPFDQPAAVGRAAEGGAAAVGRDAVDAAPITAVMVVEIRRRIGLFDLDLVANIDADLLEFRQHPLTHLRRNFVPILAVLQVGHIEQHKPIFPAGRGMFRIAFGGDGDVNRRIIRRFPAIEYLRELPAIVAGEQDVVMGQLLMALFDPPEKHQPGDRRLQSVELFSHFGKAIDELVVGGDHIGIAHQVVGRNKIAVDHHSAQLSVLMEDLLRRRGKVQLHPQAERQFAQCFDQPVHPALDVISAQTMLYIGDHIQGRRGLEGVGAVVGGIAVEQLNDVRMLKKTADTLMHGAQRIDLEQAQEGRNVFPGQQFAHLVDRGMEEDVGGHIVDPPGIAQEIRVVFRVGEGDAGELRFHRFDVLAGIETLSIIPKITADRFDRFEFQKIIPLQPGFGE